MLSLFQGPQNVTQSFFSPVSYSVPSYSSDAEPPRRLAFLGMAPGNLHAYQAPLLIFMPTLPHARQTIDNL